MIEFETVILKFKKKAEKTGWTYVEIPAHIASQIKPGTKQIYRVKGKLDNYKIKSVAILPIGEGNYIIPINTTMRKGTGKSAGDELRLELEEDKSPLLHDPDLLECLEDEPSAKKYFYELPKSHQNYYSKWISAAKTFETKSKRLLQSVNALSKSMRYDQMMRAMKGKE